MSSSRRKQIVAGVHPAVKKPSRKRKAKVGSVASAAKKGAA